MPRTKWHKKSRQKIKRFVFNFLQKQKCLDCGENDINVLEFDHVRGKKRYNISQIHKSTSSLETVKTEIKKCDVVCSNCHRKRTAKKYKWYVSYNVIEYPFSVEEINALGILQHLCN